MTKVVFVLGVLLLASSSLAKSQENIADCDSVTNWSRVYSDPDISVVISANDDEQTCMFYVSSSGPIENGSALRKASIINKQIFNQELKAEEAIQAGAAEHIISAFYRLLERQEQTPQIQQAYGIIKNSYMEISSCLTRLANRENATKLTDRVSCGTSEKQDAFILSFALQGLRMTIATSLV